MLGVRLEMGLVRLRFGSVCCRLRKFFAFCWWCGGEANEKNRAYCGMPAGMEAFRVADRVLGEMEMKGEFIREK
jgi:hypothetical protein